MSCVSARRPRRRRCASSSSGASPPRHALSVPTWRWLVRASPLRTPRAGGIGRRSREIARGRWRGTSGSRWLARSTSVTAMPTVMCRSESHWARPSPPPRRPCTTPACSTRTSAWTRASMLATTSGTTSMTSRCSPTALRRASTNTRRNAWSSPSEPAARWAVRLQARRRTATRARGPILSSSKRTLPILSALTPSLPAPRRHSMCAGGVLCGVGWGGFVDAAGSFLERGWML
mmetsp:Transcript_45811/g.113865  ORF Transcript_45811/g.113865 Transcript_45811/m.113865 type:complete len:233 (-) Transcript_45811:402-1100(-)